jgi:hypothetical protein
MVSIEIIALVLTGLSISASILYYSIELRNQNKTQQLQLETRQLQLFNSMRDKFTSYDWFRRYINVMYQQQWNDADEYFEKYNPVSNPEEYTNFGYVFATFQMAGMFLKEEAVAVEILYDDLGYAVINLYEKYKPIVERVRERVGRAWPQLDFLYESFIEYRKQHPELAR